MQSKRIQTPHTPFNLMAVALDVTDLILPRSVTQPLRQPGGPQQETLGGHDLAALALSLGSIIVKHRVPSKL